MEKQKYISHFQLFSILFISSVFSAMMYSEYMMKELDLLMYSISALSAGVILFVVSIPLMLFYKQNTDSNIIKSVQINKPVLSGFFSIVYAVYFIYSAALSMSVFALMLRSFINPEISYAAFFIVALICCYYSGFKGLSSIARASTLFFIFIIISLIFISVSLGIKINTLNYSGIYKTSFSEIAVNTLPLMAQASSLPAIFLFSHRLKGKIKKPVFLWIVISYVSIFAISLVSCGVLGDYLYLTPYPFYTATQLTAIGAFQRLDVIFLAVWTIGMFVNVSVSLYALRETIQTSLRASKAKFITPLSVIPIFIIAMLAVSIDSFREVIFNTGLMLLLFLLTAVIFPITAILLKDKKTISTRKAKVATAVILVLLIVPLFTGCNNVQLQERLLIKGIGIDGSKGDYKITVQYIDNYSEEEGQSNKAIQVEGETVGDAMNKIRNATGNEPFLGQNVAVIVGWDTAKENISGLLDYFIRYADSRPTVKLYVSETTAEDILTLEVNGELIEIDQVSNISPAGNENENLFTLLNFMVQEKNSMDSPTVSVLKADDNTVKLMSVAVFGGEKTLWELDEEQLAVYQIVNGIADGEVICLENIACRVDDGKSAVKAKEENGKLNFDVSCTLSLTILENPENISQSEIESLYKKGLKQSIEKSMYYTVNQNKCDIYNLGKNLRWNDYKTYSESENYSQELEKCNINILVDCKISNIT